MNVHIPNSYLVIDEADMIYAIKRNHYDYYTQRSVRSLVNEWKSHNILYYLNLYRDHTKDVDFEDNPKWHITCIWWILSRFYFIFTI